MQLSSLQEGGNSSIYICYREVLLYLFGKYPEQETLSDRDFLFVCLFKFH